jgi:uncharacterized alpha-E superfamily protein
LDNLHKLNNNDDHHLTPAESKSQDLFEYLQDEYEEDKDKLEQEISQVLDDSHKRNNDITGAISNIGSLLENLQNEVFINL